ncbi:zinc-ribbon domain-containing protein [Paracoccus aminophilus]|uniref:Zinc finger/thioredoxin putative domain-containing protein n=1 Tax=Paracoccus aminophilus JCM 7686 TaxID=1367847 RepID=S5YQV1_PARAH|nr:zinc-ribbon domain-containing protein [Paracoccus aminophilus]AGT07631.1 hypothetical protein JCM7686_0522 [Paracoccus aminophilus JCM 7686]
MRLICPNCDAQYEIDSTLVPPKGRDVECSSCGQVWFQPGERSAPAAVAPVLSRPLSDSVLSILREEAARELGARQSDRSVPGTEETTDAAGFAPSESPKPLSQTALHLPEPPAKERPADPPLIDWPATTVSEFDERHRMGTRAGRIELPPLTLPDAEKLAATLGPLTFAPVTPAAAPETPEMATPDDGTEGDTDALSLPGDTLPADPAPELETERPGAETLSTELFNTDTQNSEPASPGDLADPGIRAPASTSTSTTATPAEAATPLSPAPEAPASAAPVSEAPVSEAPSSAPAEAATAVNPPDDAPTPPTRRREQLPSTIVLSQRTEAESYRTGFGIAAMVALIVIGGYFLAPRIAGQGAVGAKLMEWREDIDRGRIWLYTTTGELLGRTPDAE